MFTDQHFQVGINKMANHGMCGKAPELLRITPELLILNWYGEQSDRIETRQHIVLAQNGGNAFTAVKSDGKWHYMKGWTDKSELEDWRRTNFARPDLMKLLEKTTEAKRQINYIPRRLCPTGMRFVVYGPHLLGIRSRKNENTGQWEFQFSYKERTSREKNSSWFCGKPWENVEGLNWCKSLPEPTFKGFKKFGVETMQDIIEESVSTMEERADWGLF